MAAKTLITELNPAAVPASRGAGQLSFTGHRADEGIDLWSPADAGDGWDAQCNAGREYGREAVDYMRETKDAAMLPNLARAIAERGAFGGVEVGFFAALSMALAEPV